MVVDVGQGRGRGQGHLYRGQGRDRGRGRVRLQPLQAVSQLQTLSNNVEALSSWPHPRHVCTVNPYCCFNGVVSCATK